jgi:uncharacterized protein
MIGRALRVPGARMKGKRLWAITGAAAIALGLVASWAVGGLLMRARSFDVPAAKAPASDLRLKATDGFSIAATYWPGATARAPGVLLLHGNDSSRAVMADNAAWLAGRGFAVLTIDFRGHGESTPVQHSFGLNESRDATAAFEWLKRRQKGAAVAVVGVSLGGAASLIGESGPIPVDALVLQAVYPDIRHAIRNRIAATTTAGPAYLLEPLLSLQSKPRLGVWPARLSPLARLKAYSGPVLVIGGGSDRFTPPSETKAMFAAARGPKSLWLVPGADHVEISALQSDEYRRRLLGFLRAHMQGAAEQARAP